MQMREMMFPLKKQLSLLCFVWQFTGTNFYPKFCPLSCLHNITITQYHNNTISNWETFQNIQNSNPTTGSVRPRYCERKLTPFFWQNWPPQHFACQAFSFLCLYGDNTNGQTSRYLVSRWLFNLRLEATRYEWLRYRPRFPIKPYNLTRSAAARVYADISLRYLFWRLKPLYRPVLEWQLLKLNSCSLFNRESVWSLIWTCWSQDASVPITPLRTQEMVGQNCPFVISGKHTATLSLPNDFNCQH